MPYKNPERKRQWEREHRGRRNARRRMHRLSARSGHQRISKPTPDPISSQKPQATWRTILGWAIGIGVVLLATIGTINLPPSSLPRR